MVAAWISAETGRGAFHGVGQPDVQRDLRGLAGGAQDQEQRNRGEKAGALPIRMHRDAVKDGSEVQRAEVRDEQEHCEQEADVADAVDDHRLLAGVRGRIAGVVEADQQIRGEAHALPAHEHQQEVLRQHQGEHEEEEEVHVGEEAPVPFLFGHVADRVDVDQEADAGDDAEHHQGELIELKREVGMKGSGRDPGAVGLHVRQGQRAEVDNDIQNPQGRQQRTNQGHRRHHRFGRAAADETVHQEPGEGDDREEPEVKVGHSFIRSIWSTLSVLRAR